jgi:hypothetical protein
MTNYSPFRKFTEYMRQLRTEAEADLDSMTQAHTEHDVPHRIKKEKAKQELENFLKRGPAHLLPYLL